MSGRVVHLFSLRQFDFSDVTASQNVEIPIAKALDVSQYTEGKLVVRVHTNSISGGSITVNTYITAPSAEEPLLWNTVSLGIQTMTRSP